jgi:hypothetical protein
MQVIIRKAPIIRPKTEKHYQAILERVTGGTHKVLPSGITDITTTNMHGEIKQWRKWKHSLGQLLAYNACDWRPNLHVYLFDSYTKQKKKVALDIFCAYDIRPFEFLEERDKLYLIDIFDQKVIHKEQIHI